VLEKRRAVWFLVYAGGYYWNGNSQVACAAVWTVRSWIKTESCKLIGQRLNLLQVHVLYLHQLINFWKTALHIHCVVLLVYVQSSTLTAHRCAPSPHKHTHANLHQRIKTTKEISYYIITGVLLDLHTQAHTHTHTTHTTHKQRSKIPGFPRTDRQTFSASCWAIVQCPDSQYVHRRLWSAVRHLMILLCSCLCYTCLVLDIHCFFFYILISCFIFWWSVCYIWHVIQNVELRYNISLYC